MSSFIRFLQLLFFAFIGIVVADKEGYNYLPNIEPVTRGIIGATVGFFGSWFVLMFFWEEQDLKEQRELEEYQEQQQKQQREKEKNDREFEEDRQYRRQLEKERMRLEMQREVDLKFNIKERIENLKITEQNRKRVAQIENELRNAQGKQLDQLYSEIKEFERLQ